MVLDSGSLAAFIHPRARGRRLRTRLARCSAVLALALIVAGVAGVDPVPSASHGNPVLAHGSALAAQEGRRYRDPVFSGAPILIEQDVVYGRAIDKPTGREVELLLDVYELEDDPAAARAVFVFVHGGGFRGGDKRIGRQYAQQLVPYGFVVLSITYRVSQGDQWADSMPAAVADARQALRWLDDQAAARRLDPEHVLMGGSSAGAITSLMVAYTDVARGGDAGMSEDPIAVRGVVDWWGGLYDRIGEMEAGGPPLMIVHGTEDSTVPFEQAEMLRARAEEVGIPYAWFPVEGGGHGPHDAPRDVPRLAAFFWEQVFTPRVGGDDTLYFPAALRGLDLSGSTATATREPTAPPPTAGTATPTSSSATPTTPPGARSPTPSGAVTATPTTDLRTVPMRRALDLRYAEHAGVRAALNQLDVYAPAEVAAGPYPIVLYVHGGGWSAGDKGNVGLTPNHFVHRGYVFVSTNYRLTPQATFPAHAEDVAAAVAWVRERAGEHGGDPERIALLGHSAGAHLVALVATDPRYLGAHGLTPADLSAVVPNDTQAYDIGFLAERSGGSLSETYTRVFGTDPAGWAFASPITYVAPERGIARMLIAHSGRTALGLPNRERPVHAARFRDALMAAGVEAEVLPAPDKTHGEVNRDLAVPGDAFAEAVLAWLDARLR